MATGDTVADRTEPVFFTDHNLGKVFPSILGDAGLTVQRHDDHLAEDR
jgi:hypothetical protein